MFGDNPDGTRLLLKYRHCEGKLEVKVTDNVKTVKYRTGDSGDVKRLELLQISLLQKTTTR